MKNTIKFPIFNSILKNKKNVITTIVILLISFIVVVINITGCKDGENSSLQALASSLDSLKFIHDKTLSEFGASKIKFDELASEKNVSDSAISKKNAEIYKLKNQIKKLKGENIKLASQLKKNKKKEANADNDVIATSELYLKQLKTLETEKEKLETELGDLLNKYNTMKKLASIAHASNIRFEPLHEKKNGKKEKLVTKARKLNVLRIKFDIDGNLIPEDGKKDIYLVIKGPDGKLLSNESNKSGNFSESDGSKIAYSIEKEINLQHGAPVHDLTAEWKQEGEHQKGNYTIAIYNAGHEVGFGSVALK